MDESFETILQRRSIRKYTQEQIPDTAIYRIMTAGNHAPSGKNRRPWGFVVIQDENIIYQLSMLTVYSRFLRNAPVVILLFLKIGSGYSMEKDILSVGACMQNMLLCATEMGLGTCVIGELYRQDQEVARILKFEDKSLALLCAIAIGKPAQPTALHIKDSIDHHIVKWYR